MRELQIAITDVVYDDSTRYRQEFDSSESSVAELAESLRSIGQINAIVITHDNKLIAGRRRLEAAKSLNWTHIRAIFWEDLDVLTQKIIEYDENARRKQLTWQEAARAIQEIHDLNELRAWDAGAKWSQSDTARALGISFAKVSTDLDLAKALDNPRIARRPTRRGAIETVKRERELDIVREIARRRVQNISGASPSATLTSGVLYNQDCRSILSSLADESIDLIIIDPPWGIDFDKSSQWTGKWIATYDDSPNAIRTLLTETFSLLHRVLKPACHIYCFFPIQEVQWWITALTHVGFMMRQRPLVWYKSGVPGISDVYTSFLPSYESILWGFKPGTDGVKRLFRRPIPEAQAFPRQDTTWHENSKPLEMVKSWIEGSSEVNEVVLDCFAGGGSTLAGAYELGRYFIGIENDVGNYDKCMRRMTMLEEQKEGEEKEDEND